LDEVRRLTNFSTGALGSHLANFLVEHGHEVELLLGHYATFHGEQKAQCVQTFSTTADLRDQLAKRAAPDVHAVFHAAAVSDFGFGKVFLRGSDGELIELDSPKISTRGETIVELKPTPKIINALRGWFPRARIVGWKYELEGARDDAIAKAAKQIAENKTDACVANGRAYGDGFGLVRGVSECVHFNDRAELFGAMEELARLA
jgi:phosphopantothenoylcysteine decarboxylase/phosphopantothenate--cysteine ligase